MVDHHSNVVLCYVLDLEIEGTRDILLPICLDPGLFANYKHDPHNMWGFVVVAAAAV